MATCWKLLGIKPSKNIAAIKKAYAKQAALCHPEDNPEGFALLHDAYRTALAQASEEDTPSRESRRRGRNTAEPSRPSALATSAELPEFAEQTASRFSFGAASTPEPQENAPPRFSFPVAQGPSDDLDPMEEAPSRFNFSAASTGRFEGTVPPPPQPEEAAGSAAFPKPAWQTPQNLSTATSQTAEAEKPAGGSQARGTVAATARESFTAALLASRQNSSRKIILELLEKTRKAFPRSTRSKPWEYVVTQPEFAEVHRDPLFLEALLVAMQQQPFPPGFWPVMANIYATEPALPQDDPLPSGNDPNPEVTALLARIGEEIRNAMEGGAGKGGKNLSWKARLGAFFSGK